MANALFDALMSAGVDRGKPFLDPPGGWPISFGELDERTARIGNALQSLGVEPGDRVAAPVAKSCDAITLYLGTVRAGGIFLPLNTAYTPSEIAYFLADAEPGVFVCEPDKMATLESLATENGARCLSLSGDGKGTLADLVEQQSSQFASVDRLEGDLAAILYTSGTTGRSKGAMLTHGNLLSNARVLADYWRFTAEDVLLHALPIFHTHGLFVATNVALLAGATMVFLPGFDAGEVIRQLPRCTAMMGVPTFYTRLLDHPEFTRETSETIRLFISGSAPLLVETHRAFQARAGHAILERYGMTETNMNTSNPYEGERRPGTVGFPLPGVDIRVVDPDSRSALTNGAVGMLEVRGANVCKGYWRMPEKTAAEFREDGFFITGDLGMIDDAGYVHIVGRGKDLIISGGYNVYPKEVEQEIDAIPGVLESAVIGVPHADFGEGVSAVVVLEKGASLGEAELITALSDRLARFKQPKRVFFVRELPRNTMGKVQKNVLRNTYRSAFAETQGCQER